MATLRRFGAAASLSITAQAGDATRLARSAIAEGAALLLVVGGDGTIQEVVNGLFEGGSPLNPRCEVGILSCGTGRGFADSIGLPVSVEEQLERIATRPARLVDVGRARYQTRRGTPAERLFVNECQAGIGGAVVARVGSGQKRLGGTLAFGLAALGELVRSPCPRLRVRIDDGPEVAGPLLGLIVGNGARCGGGMRLTPAATPDDGILDLVLIGSMTLPMRLWQFPRIYRGAHTRLSQVAAYRCRRLTLDSDENVPLEADGELLGVLPCSIDLLPSALRIRGAGLPARSETNGSD